MFVEKLNKTDIQYFVQNKLKFDELLKLEFKDDKILVCAIVEKKRYPKTIKNLVLKDFDLKLVIPYKFASRVKDGEIYKDKWIEFLKTNYGKNYLIELDKHNKQNELIK